MSISPGEAVVSLIGLMGTFSSTAAVIILGNVSESMHLLSERIGNIEKALINKALTLTENPR